MAELIDEMKRRHSSFVILAEQCIGGEVFRGQHEHGHFGAVYALTARHLEQLKRRDAEANG